VRAHLDQWCIFRPLWEGAASEAAEPAGATRSVRA
jgi:hypothetical protein